MILLPEAPSVRCTGCSRGLGACRGTATGALLRRAPNSRRSSRIRKPTATATVAPTAEREVLEQSHLVEETISSFTADTDKLVELVHQWDEQHQQLYANKRAAMLEHEGDSEVVPQWPPWSKGDLKESYMSSLEKAVIEIEGHQQPTRGEHQLSAAQLAREVTKYGELAQVTYDKLVTTNVFSKHFGECRDGKIELGQDTTLTIRGEATRYQVVRLLYADSGAYKLVRTDKKKKNFVGFVAVEKGAPAGRGADVAVVWRGTITRDEWIQDAKAFMVAWRGGRQVAEVPRTKLNLPPGRWLGLTTAAGLAGALYFARTHTTPLNLFIGQLNSGAVGAVRYLHEQRLHLAAHLTHALPPPASQLAAAALEPLLALGGAVTNGVVASIGALGALGAEAAAATRVVPEGAIVGVALASGLALGVSTVVLAQRLRTPKSNLQLLREDLGGLLGIVRQWLFYGFWSTFHSRLASGDARVSFGFKEMYCDVDPEGKLAKPDEGKALGPPRQQVFEALAEVLSKHQVGSITTTGHSLGGALAALCAYDIADCLNSPDGKDVEFVKERLDSLSKRAQGAALADGAKGAIEAAQEKLDKALLSTGAVDVYEATEGAVVGFCNAVKANVQRNGGMPPVTAVTFGAPRVGDRNFAAKFGAPSRMTPPLAPDAVFLNLPVVTDRLTSALSSASWWATSRGLDLENHLLFFAWSYATFMAAWLISEQALPNVAFWSPAWTPITTNGLLVLGALWQFFPVVVNTGSAAIRAIIGKAKESSGQTAAEGAQCRLRMLRVVNQGDAVPEVPLGPLFGGRWYRHGGVEMRRSPYILPDFLRFRKAPLIGSALGAALGSKHNLEVYLHLVDPTRDRHLMNKSDDVLVKTCGVPPCWYQPVESKGLHWHPDTGEVNEVAPDKKQQGAQ